MLKIMSATLLVGIIVLSAAACGNQSGDSRVPASAASEPGASAAAASQQASYESAYRTTVFLGDSITEGLSYHETLGEKQVLAGAGKTAEFALKDIDELVRRNPERVFIMLGSDDLLWPTDDPTAYSLKHYTLLIESIRAMLPKAKITLLSVTPVTAEVEKKEPRYRHIGAYNEALRELAAKKQAGYVDLTPLVHQHAELYDADGIHFKAEFYPILLDFLKDRSTDG